MKKVISIIVILIMTAPVSATIINIPADWPTIQQGIDASTDGDTVLVQPGTYIENINFNGHNIVLGSLYLTTGDTSYTVQTVIDGDSAGTVVTFNSGEDSTTVVTGFTIENGFAVNGGGIFCDSSSPGIYHNVITENNSTEKGGGLYFVNNSNPRISSNTIVGNSSYLGGGFYCESSTAVVQNNIIISNIAFQGGGFNCGSEGNLTIRANIIRSNQAAGGGSAYGGGGLIDNCPDLTVINNEFSRNSARYGGGIYLRNSNSTLIGNTIVDNVTLWNGKGIYLYESSPVIVNTIIWGNGYYLIFLSGNSSPQVSYCDINAIWEGEGNIRLNPLFVDPENNNYNIYAGSPCIDSGDPDTLDPDGTRSDIGVFFPDHPPYPQGGSRLHVSTAGNDTTGDGSEQNPFRTIQHAIDISISGDSVLVADGIYVEHINFDGHNIVLGSMFLTTGDTSYISTTIIDGNGFTAVAFISGESENAAIIGFTVEHGSSGIAIYNSNPVISYNLIKDNIHHVSGGPSAAASGISCSLSDAVITNNRIFHNGASGDEDAYGFGILCSQSSPIIANNIIMQSHASGLYPFACGIRVQFCSDLRIANNVIIQNGAEEGGGIGSYSSSFSWVVNNIIRDNYPLNISGPPTVMYCNVEGGYPGTGNIDVDPLFRDPENRDFHLMSVACGDSADSPCIDAGDPAILDSLLDCSWGLGGLRSDMGAYGGGDSLITGILDNLPPLPNQVMLFQNYPNPFNAQTTIRFVLPEPQDVQLTVYDLLGRQVETLADEYMRAGAHAVTFDASNLSSGVYFYKLQAGDKVETKRMLLLK